MKHSLQLKLSQHLTLTPQLQQSIRLLQLSTVELNQELERYLAENPLLERSDLASPDEAAPTPPGMPLPTESSSSPPAEEPREEQPTFADEHGFGEEHSSTGASRRDDDDRDDFTQFAAFEPTMQDHLHSQLALTGLTERDRQLAEIIIGYLDE